MADFTHLIVLGNENEVLHLAGLSKYSVEEVIFFDCGIGPAKELIENVEKLGVIARRRKCSREYSETFITALEEIPLREGDDKKCFAVNLSTGPRIVTAAVEDALRVLLYQFHEGLGYYEKPSCSGIRYTVERARKGVIINGAPIWDLGCSEANAITEVLLSSPTYLSISGVYERLHDMKVYLGSRDAFRRLFRRFRRWQNNSPCFFQRIKNKPEYWLR
ncbi:MAG: hypothetical protein ACFFDP_12710 [Promethearchaeota archaeon]